MNIPLAVNLENGTVLISGGPALKHPRPKVRMFAPEWTIIRVEMAHQTSLRDRYRAYG